MKTLKHHIRNHLIGIHFHKTAVFFLSEMERRLAFQLCLVASKATTRTFVCNIHQDKPWSEVWSSIRNSGGQCKIAH